MVVLYGIAKFLSGCCLDGVEEGDTHVKAETWHSSGVRVFVCSFSIDIALLWSAEIVCWVV